MSAVGAASLNYFQDYNPCREWFLSLLHSLINANCLAAIGAYVTAQ